MGYTYPEAYIDYFGPTTTRPSTFGGSTRQRAHRWYMTSRLITVNDIYSFDPNWSSITTSSKTGGPKLPAARGGLGFDGSPVAHMWRTMIWPNNSSEHVRPRPRGRPSHHQGDRAMVGVHWPTAWPVASETLPLQATDPSADSSP